MDDTQRQALEAEFEQNRARLTEMMDSLPQMQAAHAQYEAAARANAVAAAYDALKDEKEEISRMEGHVAAAQASLDAANKRNDKTGSAMAGEKLEAETLALGHAQELLAAAQARYDAEITRQGFDSEAAWQAAFLTKPAFMKLEETLTPFREEYARLLARCEEIEAQLGE